MYSVTLQLVPNVDTQHTSARLPSLYFHDVLQRNTLKSFSLHRPTTQTKSFTESVKKDAESSRSFGPRRPPEEIKCKKSEWEEPTSFFLLKPIHGSRWRFISSDNFRATAAETNTSVQRTLWTTCEDSPPRRLQNKQPVCDLEVESRLFLS